MGFKPHDDLGPPGILTWEKALGYLQMLQAYARTSGALTCTAPGPPESAPARPLHLGPAHV